MSIAEIRRIAYERAIVEIITTLVDQGVQPDNHSLARATLYREFDLRLYESFVVPALASDWLLWGSLTNRHAVKVACACAHGRITNDPR